ncbi:MAG: biopolymer transporter ExbD [Pseudomonadota bacterium]
MQLKRSRPPATLISLVSMIDVLMIMLIFFMVTSTYLNLDMVPMAERAEDSAAAPGGPGASALLIRLAADGVPHVQGRAHSLTSLGSLIATRVQADPATPVIVLPSAAASTQSLVALMDTATRAGTTSLRIIRLEVRP